MNNIKVSVIVPIYNNEKYLAQCIESILNQTMKEIEVILVDDGSTDRSGDIAFAYTMQNSRVKLYHLENGGTGRAINYGMSFARGEYVAEVDADDFVDPEMYETLYINSDGADIVKSGYYSYYNDELDVPYSLVTEKSVFCPIKLDYQSRLRVFGFQPSFWTAIYKRSFYKQLNWNETPGAAYQDTSIIFKLTAKAEKMVWLPQSFYHWRQHETNSTKGTKYVDAIRYEYKTMERFLERHPELSLSLRYVLSRLRFNSYLWNYKRIAPKDKLEFAKAASLDLQKDNDYQDVRYYSEEEYTALEMWATNPDAFHQIMEGVHDKE